MPSTKKITKKTHIFQFAKIKGVKSGFIHNHTWNEEMDRFRYEDQIATQMPTSQQYKVAVVDPQTQQILEWRDVSMMQVTHKEFEEEKIRETTQQAWNMQYKKRLAQ